MWFNRGQEEEIPGKDESTDTDEEDEEAKLLVAGPQGVNNCLQQILKYLLIRLPEDQGNGVPVWALSLA